eukprot:gene3945-15276_t
MKGKMTEDRATMYIVRHAVQEAFPIVIRHAGRRGQQLQVGSRAPDADYEGGEAAKQDLKDHLVSKDGPNTASGSNGRKKSVRLTLVVGSLTGGSRTASSTGSVFRSSHPKYAEGARTILPAMSIPDIIARIISCPGMLVACAGVVARAAFEDAATGIGLATTM